jgi:outer membrane protein assembly factor BamB/sugar lactone lactonase YvrE
MKPQPSHRIILLTLSVLVCISLACKLGLTTAQKLPIVASKAEIFASDLGTVYGLAFDQNGVLFAVGSDGERNVLWKIGPDGAKEIFAEIKDKGDVLSEAGLAYHSGALANLAVDGYGNIWIASSKHGAGFVVGPDGLATKFYVNTRLSMSVEDEKNYPHGVTWEASSQKLYIVTSGPTSDFDYTNKNFITPLTVSAAPGIYAEEIIEISDTGSNQVKAVPNQGFPLSEEGNGLLAGSDGTLYYLGKNTLFTVPDEGELVQFGEPFEGQTLWSGAADNQGYLYVSTNAEGYDPIKGGEGQGTVWRIDAKGERVVYVEGVESPLGLAFYNGNLYIADRAKGNILRVPAGKAGGEKPAAAASPVPPTAAALKPAAKPTEAAQMITNTPAPTTKPADTPTPKPTATPRPTATPIPTNTPEAFDFIANWLHFGYDDAHSAYNPLENTISLDNVAQLERKWGLGCEEGWYSAVSRAPAIYHSRLYVSGASNKLSAFHARSGRQLWLFGGGNMAWAPQPIVSEDGMVLYLEGESELYDLYAVDAESGDQLWKAPVGFNLGFSDAVMPTVDEANGLVYIVESTFMPQEGKLYALDKETGEVAWYKSQATDNLSFTGNYVVLIDGKIIAAAETPGEYEGLYQQQVVSIDAASQAVEVTYDLPPHEDYYSPYQIRDFTQCGGKLFVSYADEYHTPGKLLVAYDPAAPTIAWQKEFTQITGAIACNSDKNTLYVPTDPYLLAIDPATGAELWKYMGLGPIYSPSIANGLVYFLSDTNLYVLDEATGERVFRYPLGAQGYENAQVAIVDGMVYFSGNGGDCDLFALGLP